MFCNIYFDIFQLSESMNRIPSHNISSILFPRKSSAPGTAGSAAPPTSRIPFLPHAKSLQKPQK